MIEVSSKVLDKSVKIGRIIDHLEGTSGGPTLIFTGGIHGNEPSGVFALQQVMNHIRKLQIPVRGNIIAVAGNLWALKRGERYHIEDLNRVWTKERMDQLPSDPKEASNQDVAEQIAVNNVLQSILKKYSGPFYFFDIHTTSSKTIPFLVVNDSLHNRKFTSQYPLPVILGIEEYLEGPLLSYLNERGYVAFGFEAGHHHDITSVEKCVAFVYLSLIYTGCLTKDQVNYSQYHHLLTQTTDDFRHVYEILYRYRIKNGEKFQMLPGFCNFQEIRENQHLGNSDDRPIKARQDSRIFMPLYQSKGLDGFFIIKKIWMPFLKLSAFIRKYRLDRILVFLPGVKWIDSAKNGLVVDKQIARFMTKDIFHLFGYRSVYIDKDKLKMYSREAATQNKMYENEQWLNL